MNILTIKSNNVNNNNDLINLIKNDINNFTEDKFDNFYDEFKDELENCMINKEIIYFHEFNNEIDLNKQIEEIYINEIKDIIDINKIDNIYSSHILKYTKDYYYVLYYNNGLLNLYLTDYMTNKYNKEEKYNYLASLLLREFNYKSNVIFGDVFIIKFDVITHNYILMNNYEINDFISSLLFVKYYTEIGIPNI